MKKMKKLAGVFLALVMVVAMAMPVFATNTDNGTSMATKGQITISNATVGQTYDLYRVFELESYNKTNNVYTYKIVDAWKDFCTTGAGKDYVEIDAQGYITWTADTDAAAAEFAKAAIAYAKTNNFEATASKTVEETEALKKGDETTIVFENLDLGYYLVDSTVGTLCNLDTTNNNIQISDKNVKPTTDKEVKEDSTDEYGDKNDAEIGQDVEYKTTITAQKGAINYTLHDKMTGLDFKQVDKITLKKAGEATETDVEDTNYTVKTTGVCAKECSFEVEFNNEFTATLGNGDQIIVYYTATVNKDAVVAGIGNPNKTSLTYGDNPDNLNETEEDETKTYTFEFDLVKTTESNELLTGATFQLFTTEDGTTPIQFVKENGNYRKATEADKTTSADIVVEGGKVTIIGLDGGSSYWLEETVAPDGYNKLAGRVEVKLTEMVIDGEGNASVNIGSGENAGASDAEVNGDTYVSGGVEVENKAGSLLPSTGGIGTTIFYVVGTILVLGAGILLVTKRRMKAQ